MAQISCQAPLSDEWFAKPCALTEPYIRAQEADVKGLVSPGEARRMSRILRRAVCTSLTALKQSGIEMPAAIITGTGMGCMENSEKFLIDLCQYGESCLKPTLFMQSTHNTISSLIAIMLKCHGYNNTYSHKGISFESALFDAWLQIKSGQIGNALIGSHDEVTPFTANVLRHAYPQCAVLSETSMSAVLSADKTANTYAEVMNVEILHRPELDDVASKVDCNEPLMLGVNGNELNDEPYCALLQRLPSKPHSLQYKNVFGDNFSASALSLYVGAKIIKEQSVPQHLVWNSPAADIRKIDGMTILNHSEGTWTVVKLKKA
jgi:hypothetical protein